MAQPNHAGVAAEPKQSIAAFQRLLVATDFSSVSIAALSYAESLTNLYGKELLLTCVVSAGNASPPEPPAVFAAPEIGQAMAEDLEQLANQLRRRGIDARAILAEGPVADALEQLVQKEKPDLLVIGTHGARGLERLILGSTAEAILRKVSCPVLTVGPACGNITRKNLALQTIVYATVLRHPSETALRYAASLARAMHAHMEIAKRLVDPQDTDGPAHVPTSDSLKENQSYDFHRHSSARCNFTQTDPSSRGPRLFQEPDARLLGDDPGLRPGLSSLSRRGRLHTAP